MFYVDSANSRNWKPSPEGSSGGSAVHVVDDLIRTFQNDKIVEEVSDSAYKWVANMLLRFSEAISISRTNFNGTYRVDL